MTYTCGHVLTNTSYDSASASHEITKTIITKLCSRYCQSCEIYESIDLIVWNLPCLVTVCDIRADPHVFKALYRLQPQDIQKIGKYFESSFSSLDTKAYFKLYRPWKNIVGIEHGRRSPRVQPETVHEKVQNPLCKIHWNLSTLKLWPILSQQQRNGSYQDVLGIHELCQKWSQEGQEDQERFPKKTKMTSPCPEFNSYLLHKPGSYALFTSTCLMPCSRLKKKIENKG